MPAQDPPPRVVGHWDGRGRKPCRGVWWSVPRRDGRPSCNGHRGVCCPTYPGTAADGRTRQSKVPPTIDINQRKSIYTQVQRLFDADPPYLYFYVINNYFPAKPTVKNFVPMASGYLLSLIDTSIG
ncbi:MAG TPA: hypothetical protein VMW65_10335 [Chloroflexota bacterium]|nr:hypothetical protein [Chloroflexota bacterium]